MNKPVNSLIFKTSLLAALLTSALGAQAAGLGKLTVYSGIGQPLNAEVALTATPAELNSLTAKLASHEAFKEAGIEYMSALAGVRFSLVKQSNNQSVLKLTTERPVNEPFLHFLVELNWSAGRMLREYTFLLDPPEMLQVAKAASVVAPVTPTVAPLPPTLVTGQAKPPVLAPQVRPTSPDTAKPSRVAPAVGEYQVKSGDSLGKIARATKPESVSLDQMLVALFNDNRDAFDGNNMNRLRAGKILRLPGADEAAKVDPVEARKLVIGQVGDFNAYRRRLAETAAMAPPADAAPKQQVSGSIRPQVQDKTPPAPKQDKLEVSRTEPAKSAKPIDGSSLEEDLIARDKALREAAERIALLEKNIVNLKQLVEIKSQTGTKLQQESQAALPKPADKPADSAPLVPATKPEEVSKAVPASEPAPAKPAELVPPVTAQPPAKKPVAPLSALPPEPSFIEENPQVVFGGGGLIALLLGYLGYSSWRRKKQAEGAGEDMLASLSEMESPEPRAAAVASPASASFDSGEVSIQGDFSDGGALTTEEIVDPVAEADVLMAYGRDRQAEEILQEGLKRDPTRTAIHMKLLALYAKQENIAQFETVAKDLHKLNGGRGADWDKALSMAHILGLSGGVFLGAGAIAGALKPEVPQDAVEPSVTGEEPTPQADETIVPSLSVEEAISPAKAEEIASLDFDLDLGTTSGQAIAVAAAEQAATVAAAEKSEALDFDFDLGTPSVESLEAVAQQQPAVNTDESNVAGLDFDLDLGSPVEAVTDALDRDETDFARSASPENVVDLTSDLTAFSERGVAERVGELKIDFDLELDGAPAAAVPVSTGPAIEPQNLSANQPMGGTDMDFGFDLNDLQPETVAGAEVSGQAASEIDNSEAETKLELAHAYVEMGDLEGARELFNEVVNEGSSAQRAKAQAKLDQLDV
ncbi:MAG: FimV/HubP family polar landmark protein [Rhodocyclaceae bacterium]|nr:FimV/HubP family polar landmark protein [Rhodocyclaceae bacterium]